MDKVAALPSFNLLSKNGSSTRLISVDSEPFKVLRYDRKDFNIVSPTAPIITPPVVTGVVPPDGSPVQLTLNPLENTSVSFPEDYPTYLGVRLLLARSGETGPSAFSGRIFASLSSHGSKRDSYLVGTSDGVIDAIWFPARTLFRESRRYPVPISYLSGGALGLAETVDITAVGFPGGLHFEATLVGFSDWVEALKSYGPSRA